MPDIIGEIPIFHLPWTTQVNNWYFRFYLLAELFLRISKLPYTPLLCSWGWILVLFRRGCLFFYVCAWCTHSMGTIAQAGTCGGRKLTSGFFLSLFYFVRQDPWTWPTSEPQEPPIAAHSALRVQMSLARFLGRCCRYELRFSFVFGTYSCGEPAPYPYQRDLKVQLSFYTNCCLERSSCGLAWSIQMYFKRGMDSPYQNQSMRGSLLRESSLLALKTEGKK